MKFVLRCARNYLKKQDPIYKFLVEDGFIIDEKGYHDCKPEIEINSLEDLLALSHKYGSKLVFEPTPPEFDPDQRPVITIYNDYLE